ncbi:hypothetical protein FH972_027143 [Carpinus fangiana]|uniref:Uncharacterized protein n=1 Tax=Carpinus fangiana TaxID=176857 RepID=A0A5N6L6B3_9ROSI|nr:hypothetical protein FH972_027143 [Carpinus fangiana]
MGRKNGKYEVKKEVVRKAFWDGIIDFDVHERLMVMLQAEEECRTGDGWVAVAESGFGCRLVQEAKVSPGTTVHAGTEAVNDGEVLAAAGETTPVTTESSHGPMLSDSTDRIEDGDGRESVESRDAKERHLFAWCPCCRKMRVAIFPNEPLGLSRLHTIMVVYCGRCTRETGGAEEKTTVNKKKKNQRRGSEGSVGEEWGPQWKGLNISPEVWRGSEAGDVAKTIVGKEVDFLTDGKGGTAYLEAAEFWRGMGKGVRIGSVDVEGF